MTTGGMMILVACLGISCGLIRFYLLYIDPFNGFGTIYSKGYSEDHFQMLRIGMTAKQVESILGPPLWKIPRSDDEVVEIWEYSGPPHDEANYWRRWVFIGNGRVEAVVSDFWID
jgi:hypothetical protein